MLKIVFLDDNQRGILRIAGFTDFLGGRLLPTTLLRRQSWDNAEVASLSLAMTNRYKKSDEPINPSLLYHKIVIRKSKILNQKPYRFFQQGFKGLQEGCACCAVDYAVVAA